MLCLIALLSGCGGGTKAPVGASTGEGAWVLGQAGRGVGEFSRPRAIIIDAASRLLVVDRTGRVQTFNAETGQPLKQWDFPEHINGTPTGVSLDPVDGTVWVADTHYQRILHYDMEGNLLSSFGENGTGPGQMIFPTDVAPDPDGETLWVSEYGLRARLMRFTREGEFVSEWATEAYQYSDLQRPQAIEVAQDGTIFVADAGNSRVLLFDRDGKLKSSWGDVGDAPGQLRYPYDLALAGDGTLFVCEYGNSRVSHFTHDGEFLGFWGGVGTDPGRLWSPWGVAVGPGGMIAVADTNNHRVQVLRHPDRAFHAKGEAI